MILKCHRNETESFRAPTQVSTSTAFSTSSMNLDRSKRRSVHNNNNTIDTQPLQSINLLKLLNREYITIYMM